MGYGKSREFFIDKCVGTLTSEPCIQVGVRAAMPPCETANPSANTIKLLIALNSNFFTTEVF